MAKTLREMPMSAFACWSRGGADCLGDEAARGRREEGGAGPVDRGDQGELPELGHARQEDERARRLAHGADEVGGDHHVLAGQTVGPDTADEHQRDPRDEARGEDEPDRRGRATDLERGERHRDEHHRISDGGEALGGPEQPKTWLLESAEAVADRHQTAASTLVARPKWPGTSPCRHRGPETPRAPPVARLSEVRSGIPGSGLV